MGSVRGVIRVGEFVRECEEVPKRCSEVCMGVWHRLGRMPRKQHKLRWMHGGQCSMSVEESG